MTNRCLEFALIFVLVLILRIPPAFGTNFTTDNQVAKRFGTHEIILNGNGLVLNPFETVSTVTFTPPSGSAKEVIVRAFYNGGNTWRARVYVTEVGIWHWKSASFADPLMNGKTGSFTTLNSNLRGMLKKNPSNPRAWVTDDGRWFVAISDTTWYLFESPRVYRRLHHLRGWSHGQTEALPTGST